MMREKQCTLGQDSVPRIYQATNFLILGIGTGYEQKPIICIVMKFLLFTNNLFTKLMILLS